MKKKQVLSGINGFSGAYFLAWFAPEETINGKKFTRDGSITRTDTIPITLALQDSAGQPLRDIAGEKLVISFDTEEACRPENEILLSVEILPQTPTTNGIFAGSITDDQTYTLPAGNTYVTLKHINAAGETTIWDACKTVVNPCVSTRRA